MLPFQEAPSPCTSRWRGCVLRSNRVARVTTRWQAAIRVEVDDLAARLGQNVRQLREARGMTQNQMAKLAELPRATWANIESGASNPTLAVLNRVATAFQVTLEELIAVPRAATQFYPADS